MGRQHHTWDTAVARLGDIDHRQSRVIIQRACLNAASYQRIHRAAEPLERLRMAAVAARDAIALYLLDGGDPDHLAHFVGLLDISSEGPRAVGSLTDRAIIGRSLVDAYRATNRDHRLIDDLTAAAAALEYPHRRPAAPAPAAAVADEQPAAGTGSVVITGGPIPDATVADRPRWKPDPVEPLDIS